jgi:ABC-type nitrate/sulfonate/bicarbonate transport system permease component
VEVGRVDEICGIVVLVVVMALLPVVLIEAIERRIMRKRTPGVR